MAFRSDELKIPSGKKNKAEKGQEPADPSQLEVQDAGTGGENLPNWGMHLTPDGPISCGLPLPQPAREGNHPAEVVGPTPEAHCASWRHGGG